MGQGYAPRRAAGAAAACRAARSRHRKRRRTNSAQANREPRRGPERPGRDLWRSQPAPAGASPRSRLRPSRSTPEPPSASHAAGARSMRGSIFTACVRAMLMPRSATSSPAARRRATAMCSSSPARALTSKPMKGAISGPRSSAVCSAASCRIGCASRRCERMW